MKHAGSWVGLFLALLGIQANAETFEVTHTPGAGQYGTVQAAFDAASSGDTVVIIDNSEPFIERVLLNKSGIAVKGQDGLDPRPEVQADPAVGHTILSVGASDNLVENLVLRAGDWSAVNVSDGGLLTLRNCLLDGNKAAGGHCNLGVVTNAGKPLALIDCVLTGGSYGLLIQGACTVSLTDCTVEANWMKELFVAASADSAPASLTLSNTVVRADAAADRGIGYHRMLSHEGSSMLLNLSIDNCTFIGDPAIMDVGLGSTVPNGTFSITDSIFYNLPNVYQGSTFVSFTEDYNVYQKAPNTAGWYGAVGAHSVSLADGDPLFVDAATGDYMLNATSVAATLNSTGTPAYAGALPVAEPPVNQWANISIPQRRVAPAIDGTVNASEWEDANPIVMNHANMLASFGFAGAATNPTDADFSGTFYFLWDADFLYGAAKVNDATLVYLATAGAPLNGTDAAQLIVTNIDAKAGATDSPGQYIFDFAPGTSDATGTASVYEHWEAGSAANAVVKSRLVTGGYELEWKIKWSDLSNHPITPAVGSQIGFATLLINKTSTAAGDFWIGAPLGDWSDMGRLNTATLSQSVPVELSTFSVE